MPVTYYLQKNPITPDPDDYTARIVYEPTMTVDDLIDDIQKYGTTLDRVEIEGVVKLFFRSIVDRVSNGHIVNTPVAIIRPGLSGTFKSAGASFDSSIHNKKASLSAGKMLKEAMLNATVQKSLSSVPKPVLTEFADKSSGTTNDILTPGSIGIITGAELKFDPTNASEGIFFIDSAKAETKVDLVAERTEGKLTFLIPATLVKGEYKLVVRKGFTTNVSIREGELNEELEVK
jgi:hypothetical protein